MRGNGAVGEMVVCIDRCEVVEEDGGMNRWWCGLMRALGRSRKMVSWIDEFTRKVEEDGGVYR